MAFETTQNRTITPVNSVILFTSLIAVLSTPFHRFLLYTFHLGPYKSIFTSMYPRKCLKKKPGFE